MQAIEPSIEELAGDIVGLVRVLFHAESNSWLQTVSDLDLSTSQVKALIVLSEPGEPSVKDLAATLGLSLPATSRAVDQLVQRDLVERRECAHDRRSRLLRLSPAGVRAVEAITSARVAGVAAFLRTLSPEQRDALHAAIRPILEHR